MKLLLGSITKREDADSAAAKLREQYGYDFVVKEHDTRFQIEVVSDESISAPERAAMQRVIASI